MIIHLFSVTVDGCPTIPDRPQRPRPRAPAMLQSRADAESFPHWFTQFLNDRQTRKPSAHTMKAYRQDFLAIAMPDDRRQPCTAHGG